MAEVGKFTKPAIMAIALGIVVLMGIAFMTQFSIQLRDETIAANNGITVLVNTSVDVGTASTRPFLQTVTGCVNASNASLPLNAGNYTVTTGDASDAGTIILAQTGLLFNNTAVNCTTVTYLADSEGQDSADNFISGIAIFGTFMVVIVLGIVGMFIIGMFRRKT